MHCIRKMYISGKSPNLEYPNLRISKHFSNLIQISNIQSPKIFKSPISNLQCPISNINICTYVIYPMSKFPKQCLALWGPCGFFYVLDTACPGLRGLIPVPQIVQKPIFGSQHTILPPRCRGAAGVLRSRMFSDFGKHFGSPNQQKCQYFIKKMYIFSIQL